MKRLLILPFVGAALAAPATAFAQYPYGSGGGYVVVQPVVRVEYSLRITDRETITTRGPNGYSISQNTWQTTIADGRRVDTHDYYRESLKVTPTTYDWRRDYGGSYHVRPATTTYYTYGGRLYVK